MNGTARPSDVVDEPFPARIKNVGGDVNGIHTEVMYISFADKIMITISQGGRLAHWVHVPLDTPTADPTTSAIRNTYGEEEDAEPSDLLPMSHLTATTVLGGTIPERDTIGQLYATQIASAISTKNPDEKRLVIVGMGLEKADSDRETFLSMIDLMLKVI